MAEPDTPPPADPAPQATLEEDPTLSDESLHPHHHHSRPRHHGRQNHRHHHHHHRKHEEHHSNKDSDTENVDGGIASTSPAMDEPAFANGEPDQGFPEEEPPSADRHPAEPAAEGAQQKVSRDLVPSGDFVGLAPEGQAQDEATPSENPSPVHVVLPLPPPLEELASVGNPFSALLSEEASVLSEGNQVSDASEVGIAEEKAPAPYQEAQEETSALTGQEVGSEAAHGEDSVHIAPEEASYDAHKEEVAHGENSAQKEFPVHDTDDARKEDADRDVSTHSVDDAQKEDTHPKPSAHNLVDVQKDGSTNSQQAVHPESEGGETLQEEPTLKDITSATAPGEGALASEQDAKEQTSTGHIRHSSVDETTAEGTPSSGVDRKISGGEVRDDKIPAETPGKAFSDSVSQDEAPLEDDSHASAAEVTKESNAGGSMLNEVCLGDKDNPIAREAKINEATDIKELHHEDLNVDKGPKDATSSQGVDGETVSKPLLSVAPSQGMRNECISSEPPVNVGSREVTPDGEGPYPNKQSSLVDSFTANGDVKEPEADQDSKKQTRVDYEKDRYEGINRTDVTSQEVQKIEPTKEEVIESSSGSKVPLFFAAAGIIIAVAGIAVASFSRRR